MALRFQRSFAGFAPQLACLLVFLPLCWSGCSLTGNGSKVRLSYGFDKGASHASLVKGTVALKFGKIVLPENEAGKAIKSRFPKKVVLPGATGAGQDSGQAPSLLPPEIAALSRRGLLRSITVEWSAEDSSQVADVSKDGKADISSRRHLQALSLQANGVHIPVDRLALLLRSMLAEAETRRCNPSGEWDDLPRLLGMSLPANISDPYAGKLLSYLRTGFAYPAGKIAFGQSWNNDLQVEVPVDSLSSGQSRGFVRVDISNRQRLEKVQNGIAHIALELSVNIAWDVIVQEQGRTRFNLTLDGTGYRFFDLKRKWEQGMFIKGPVVVSLNAEAADKKGRKIPTVVEASGNVELASKIK